MVSLTLIKKFTPSLSIIIPALNENDLLKKTIYSINDTIELTNYEIIVIDSGGTKTSEVKKLELVDVYDSPIRLGSPEARNYGADKASGNNLIFIDAHMEFKNGWSHKVLDDIEVNKNCIINTCITVKGNEGSKAYGFRWNNLNMDIDWMPHTELKTLFDIPFAGGAFMAMKKGLFQRIGKFDSNLRFYGGEDYEFCLRSWLLGYNVKCDPSIEVSHVFRSSFPYEISWRDIHYNKIRIALSHFSTERLSRFLNFYSATFTDIKEFNELLLMNIENGILDRRLSLFNNRFYDDNWFFKKFYMQSWS